MRAGGPLVTDRWSARPILSMLKNILPRISQVDLVHQSIDWWYIFDI